MREQDIPRVVLLDQQCYGPMGLWTADMYAEEVNGERSEIVVLETRGATVGSEIVGVCALSHVLDEGSITNVAVSPYSRRQGGSSVLPRAYPPFLAFSFPFSIATQSGHPDTHFNIDRERELNTKMLP